MLRDMSKTVWICVALLFTIGTAGWIYIASDSSTTDTCTAEKYQTDCFIQKVEQFTKTGDINGALAYAIEIIAPESRNSLHMSMHVIGRAAYLTSRSRDNAMAMLPNDAFTDDGHLIYDGFQHGVLQALFVEKGENTSVHTLIKESCGSYWIEENDPRGLSPQRTGLGCFHGVGHALMALYKNDVEKSVDVCTTLPYAWMQERCGYGVFMEASYAFYPSYTEHAMHAEHNTSESSMKNVCINASALKEVCALFVGHSYLMSHANNYAGAFSTCKEMSEDLATECDIYLAEVIFPGMTHDTEKLINACATAGSSQERCLLWVAHGLHNGYGGPEGRKIDFCAVVPKDVTKKCENFLSASTT